MPYEQSKKDKAYNLIRRIYRSYPDFPATCNPCPIEGCGDTAVGSDNCDKCLFEELRDLLPDNEHYLVHRLELAMENKSEAVSDILDALS